METLAYFIGAMFAVFDGMYQVYVDACRVFVQSDRMGMIISMWFVFVVMFLMMFIGMFTSVRGVYRNVKG